MNNSFQFTEQNIAEAKSIINNYPDDYRFSAIMPILTLAQKQNGGYLTEDVISYVASFLNVSNQAINEVANFYSMYNLKPVGKYVIQICNSVVCNVKGSNELINYAKQITNTENINVSKDGLFTVKKVECLGACVNACAIKINDIFVEDVTNDSLKTIVDNLSKGKELEEIFNKKRSLLENKE